ncbi:DUF6019 family protein [Romboutsia sp. 1001713B170131_170501_G6]
MGISGWVALIIIFALCFVIKLAVRTGID